MRLIFVRHGEPAWHDDRGLGRADPPLTGRGHRQAARVAEALKGVEVDELWVSPAVRARQTCEPVAAALDREPVVHDWLLEVQIPVLAGKTREEVKRIFAPARKLPVADWWKGVDGCEPYDAFAERIAGGLDRTLAGFGAERVVEGDAVLWQGLPDRTVVAVCHAATTAVAVSHLVGLGQVPWSWIRLPVGHTGIAECRSTWMATSACFSLARLDDRAHLDPHDLTL